MSRRRFVMLLAAVAPFAFGACGSSSSSSSSSTASSTTSGSSRISVSAFIASADGICKAGETALAPVNTITSRTSDTAAQQILDSASGVLTVAGSQLDALTVPPSLAASWGTFVNDVKRETIDISAMADALGAGDSASFSRYLNDVHQVDQQANKALAGKGFSHCGRGK